MAGTEVALGVDHAVPGDVSAVRWDGGEGKSDLASRAPEAQRGGDVAIGGHGARGDLLDDPEDFLMKPRADDSDGSVALRIVGHGSLRPMVG